MPSAPKKPADAATANNERNEYIPSFIAKKPFYVDDSAESGKADDYLEHQRLQKASDTDSISKWYDRGRKLAPAATKFRKGACENCGALTHKAKDCLSRPRKSGARWTGRDIQADENVQSVDLGWDAKRDRWNGFDPTEYKQVVNEYNELEEMKRVAKGGAGDENGDAGGVDEGAKYEEETDMGRKQSNATRALRIREDTAKYLLNLDLDSAKYDPKTRSMTDTGAGVDQAAALVAEEGFMKASGDASEFEKAQKYAWETQERGDRNKLHLQANPTHGEYFRKKEQQEADAKRAAQQKALAEKYGSQETVQKRPGKDMDVTESERFVEYDQSGAVKGAPKTKAKSKYPEDILINNHTSVWGSWWSDFHWGYACCHSTVKNSYCTGEEGRNAFDDASRLRLAEDIDEVPKEVAWKEDMTLEEHVPNAVEKDEKAKRDATSRKRTLQEIRDGVTEEEIEEYQRKRRVADDPMAAIIGRNELVH